jgi:hypothetical protein
MLLVLTPLK